MLQRGRNRKLEKNFLGNKHSNNLKLKLIFSHAEQR